ncbi:MAG: C39 family peptidase, partial [Chloroflexota bacterium]
MIFQPSKPVTLSVPYIEQRYPGECLAACAAMVIEYLNLHTSTLQKRKVRYSYRQLLRVLQIKRHVGTPFSQIQRLDRLKLNIAYETQGELETLYELLVAGWPPIVAVQTEELPHWNGVSSMHTIVVIGMDSEFIYVNDPEFPDIPIPIPIGEFDLA